MPVVVRLPTVLRRHADNQPTLEATGSTLREIFEEIGGRYPELKKQVVGDDGNLHKFLNVYLNDDDVRYLDRLDTKVSDGDSVTVLPAVAGG